MEVLKSVSEQTASEYEMSEIKLEVSHIRKQFDGEEVLKDISFQVKKGEFLAILGLSGCGKTTLLRILIGLEHPDSGSIKKDGKEISKLAPNERGMGIIFQNYALFPNMTVLDNVAYALKLKKETKASAKEIALHTLEQIGMSEHLNKKPRQLSGGQQQRVAIARSLITRPKLLLADEPTGNLDSENSKIVVDYLKKIHHQNDITIIMVTHDLELAKNCDRIYVLEQGKLREYET